MAKQAAAQRQVQQSAAERDEQPQLPKLEANASEPSPLQLEKAKKEAEKALKDLERQGGGDSTLSDRKSAV